MDDQAVDALLRSGTPAFDDERPAEEVLIEALDRAAVRFVRLLEDDGKNEDGNFTITLDQRLDIFKMGRDWIAIRRRTQIGDQQGDQKGVRDMQDRIKGEAKAPAEPERRRVGRPTREEAAQRKAAEEERLAAEAKERENDDSGWQSRLAQANGNGA